MPEQVRDKEKETSGEKKTVKVTIKMMGKKKVITVPRGTKVLDALKEADLNINLKNMVLRLNGKELKRNEDEELENPAIEEDSMLVLVEKIIGGRN